MKKLIIAILVVLASTVAQAQSRDSRSASFNGDWVGAFVKTIKFENPPSYIDGVDITVRFHLNQKMEVVEIELVNDYDMPKQAAEVIRAVKIANQSKNRPFDVVQNSFEINDDSSFSVTKVLKVYFNHKFKWI